jgi:hypothetical protein
LVGASLDCDEHLMEGLHTANQFTQILLRMTKDDPKNLGGIWVWLAGALRMASHKSMTSSNILIKNFVLKFYGQPSVVFFLGTF